MRKSLLALRLLVAMLLSAAAPALAQNAKGTTPTAKAAAGTYQLVQQTKRQYALTTDALAEIESRRQDTKEVSWQVAPYARVRILPRSVINKPGFKPLAPTVYAEGVAH